MSYHTDEQLQRPIRLQAWRVQKAHVQAYSPYPLSRLRQRRFA